MLCSLSKQRHLLCLGSLKKSRSVLPLLSGIVLAFVGPQDVGEPLAFVSSLAVSCFSISNRKTLLWNASYKPLLS